MPPVGYALALGVGQRAPDAFGHGMFRRLSGCHEGARALAALAEARGFVVAPAPDSVACVTRAYVSQWLVATAARARAGDTVLVTFCGHGAVVPPGGTGRALVLYDGWLLDQELLDLLRRFERGVRVTLVLDCCYGGGLLAQAPGTLASRDPLVAELVVLAAGPAHAAVPAAQHPAALSPFTGRVLDAWRQAGGRFDQGWTGLRDVIGEEAHLSWSPPDTPLRFQQPFTI